MNARVFDARIRGLRRRRGAGAAMVEAVVTVPTFLVLFAASIFVWRLYVSKIEMQNRARFQLWTYAISDNCGDTGDPGVGGNDAAQADMSNGTVTDSSQGAANTGANANQGISTVGGGGQTGIMSSGFAGKTYAVSSSVNAGGVIGGFTAPVSAKRTMLCNEPPHNGNLKGLALGAWHTLTSW